MGWGDMQQMNHSSVIEINDLLGLLCDLCRPRPVGGIKVGDR